jgi:cytochrome c
MVRITLCYLAMFILVQFFSISDLEAKPCFYQYQETRQLVSYVERVAQKFARDGRSAFSAFRKRSGQWVHDDRHLFIFDMAGRLVLHSEEPELVGTNLANYTDSDGKPFFRHMVEVVNESERGAGWVHYRAYRHDQVFPEWRATYVTKVENRSGETYIIGSGLDSPRLEKQFIKDLVDSAARLVEAKGISVLNDLNEKSGRFVFGDVMMMVFKMDGTLIVDPSDPASNQDNQVAKRNLIDYRDAIGNYVYRDIIARLKAKDSAWVLYMWPKPGEIKPSKKVVYVRKVEVDGIPYLIGSSFFIARPVWMK